MAEGGLLGLDTSVDPDQQILDFLGSKSPMFHQAQAALPVTGAAAVGAPQGPVGLAGGLRLVGGTGAPGGPSSRGALGTALSATEDALKGLKFADLAKTVFGSGPDAGAVETPSGALTGGFSDRLRDLGQFNPPEGSFAGGLSEVGGAAPGVLGGAVTEGVQGSFTGGLSEVGGGAAAGVAGSEIGAIAGEALPYVGAVPGIVLAALSDEPNWMKAVDSGLVTAGAALAPATYGVSSLVAGIADLLVHLFANQQGDYIPQRKEALDIAKTGLGELGGSYQQAAQSGDPAQALEALGTTQAGGHVYSGLSLPPDIARQMGLATPPGAETVPVDWNSLNPQQFEQFLGLVQQNPDALGQWVTGSGDVPYLPQGTAQKAADQAAQDARAMLTFLTAQQQAAPEMTQAPQPPAAMSVGGGAMELPEEITP